jgi:1-acyl-sn-glycerol-3-phosphate acyltransferase
MSNFFLKIFDFFQHRKTLLWLLLATIIGLLTFSALRISFVEDISSFLPNNADNKRINEAFQKIGVANKIIVRFEMSDMQENQSQIDILIDAATRFAEKIKKNDSIGHIKELMYEIDNDKIREVTDFITQNLPYFLEEEDYRRIDSLIQPQNIENQLRIDKELLMSPMGGFVRNVILNDPLHFSQNALKNVEVFKQGDNYNTDNGFIFNDKDECIVIITSKYPISETANNKLLANEIYKAVNQTTADFNNEIKIVPFGAALISITNADQIKSDSLFAVSIAVVLILTLMFYFYRNVKSLFFIALSVAFGALFSFGVIVLFKSTVSIIAIGVSSIIFGIAINYPLHFLAYLRHTPNIKHTIKVIVNPLLIGNITTVGAFLSLLFISSDAMKDLGLFSSFLLAGTIAFVLIFLPHFWGGVKVKEVKELTFGKLAEFLPEKNRFIVLIFLIFTVVLFFFSFGTKFETNLQTINYMTAEQRTEMNKLIEQNSGIGKKHYVVAEGKNTEEALQNYEKLILPRMHEFSSKSGISNLFPSKELQKQKIEFWNEFWQDKKDIFAKNFNEISKNQKFNDNVFENFITTLNKNFQPQEFEYFAPIYKDLGENYFSISSDKTLIYTIIQDTTNSFNFLTPINSPIFTFDDSSMAEKMVDALSNDFNNVLYICGFIVFAFLLFSFGRIELAIVTFIPLTVAWVWILGLMNIFDLKFNIVNIILATFIFGQGDDYTILITEGLMHEYTYHKKMLAKFKNSIILSSTILFIAIGMLIFAKHPAMRSLANLTIVGMISVVMCAYLFPPLIFRFLTTKKGKPREVPWTLKRFLRMVYAFMAFLLGSLLTTIYGFLLLGFRKKPNKKNKLRYHRLLQWSADFVIRRVPGVKFSYENLSGETFDKPAVIISNHQSHLDLMCLMMLTPKLIILTNDWVWNSPFYGRIIQYADFYPVSKGIENSIGQLAEAVHNGYSIVIFPEGTRSKDCSIGRFHQGAFYLAEKLNLDILTVFLHGVGHVLPKNDFLLREGQITVQVRERIALNDNRFASDYSTRAKQVRQYYREAFAGISEKIETLDYFKSFVLYNYMYKGLEVWRGAKKELEGVKTFERVVKELEEKTVLIKNNGYGVYSFLYALSHKNTQVIAVEEDEEKVAIAKNCAGIPKNLTIYHTSEWTNVLSS